MSGVSQLVKIGVGMLAASAPRQAWNLLTAGAVERVVVQGDPASLPGTVGRYLEKVATVLWRPNPPIALSREYDRRTNRWASIPGPRDPRRKQHRRRPRSWTRSALDAAGFNCGADATLRPGSCTRPPRRPTSPS